MERGTEKRGNCLSPLLTYIFLFLQVSFEPPPPVNYELASFEFEHFFQSINEQKYSLISNADHFMPSTSIAPPFTFLPPLAFHGIVNDCLDGKPSGLGEKRRRENAMKPKNGAGRAEKRSKSRKCRCQNKKHLWIGNTASGECPSPLSK